MLAFWLGAQLERLNVQLQAAIIKHCRVHIPFVGAYGVSLHFLPGGQRVEVLTSALGWNFFSLLWCLRRFILGA